MRVTTGTIEIREGDTPAQVDAKFRRLRREMDEAITKPAGRYESTDAPEQREPSVEVIEGT